MFLFRKDKILLANQIKKADNFYMKFKGLMGVKDLNEEEGLILFHCSSIHCFFMRMTIDAVYLSKDFIVLDMETLKPWKIGKRVKGAAHVLELKGNTASGKMKIGDQLILKE